MRAGESSGAKAVFAKQTLDEPSGRSFSVGAGYVNHAVRTLWVAEQLDGSAGWLEARAKFVLWDARN
jgi:hypothetical protein